MALMCEISTCGGSTILTSEYWGMGPGGCKLKRYSVFCAEVVKLLVVSEAAWKIAGIGVKPAELPESISSELSEVYT